MTLWSVIAYLGIKIVALFFGIRNYKFLNAGYKLLLIQVFVALIAESIGKYFSGQKIANTWLFNLYILIELLLLTSVAMHFIYKKKSKIVVWVTMGLIAVIWVVNLFNTGLHNLFNWPFVLSAFYYVILYTHVIFSNSLFNKQRLHDSPLFLFCISIIGYFACIIPLFGLINYLIIDNPVIAEKLYYFNVGVSILRYTLVAIAFYLYARQAKKAYVQQ